MGESLNLLWCLRVSELVATEGVVVAFGRNGWMNKELTKDWVDRFFQ